MRMKQTLIIPFACCILALCCSCGKQGNINDTESETVTESIQSAENTGAEDNTVSEKDIIIEEITDGTSVPAEIDEGEACTSRLSVARYLHDYGHLPANFITLEEAKAKGWEGGSLEAIAPGKMIGGDEYANEEKEFPEKEGRIYYSCDLDSMGKPDRGTKRPIYSNDGLIYFWDCESHEQEKIEFTD
ncbi:MAG: ribonuclease [Lachnospiraceae bacterium]|nr:ribonuclease [Lachnospiraceae bacterium]